MKYFALSPDDSWNVNPQKFAHQLALRWPTVEIEEQTAEDSRYFDFDLRMPHSRVVGGFARAGDAFIMEGDLRDCVQLALWFRSIVPPEHPLVFCDEGYAYDIALTPGTTDAEVFSAFEYTPPGAG